MRKTVKVLCLILAVVLIIGIGYVACGLLGNPISKMIAGRNAKKYVLAQYSGTDYKVESAKYNFKFGEYYVRVYSPSSADTDFDIILTGSGKIKSDEYEDKVKNKWNTYMRLDNSYRDYVEKVLDSDDFPYKSHIAYGQIRDINDVSADAIDKIFGIDSRSLVLDKEYDIAELGRQAGSIIFYAEDDDVSVKRASEILYEVTKALDDKNVTFHCITFVLQKPKSENVDSSQKQINLIDFNHGDVYSDDLISIVQKAKAEADEYYERMDSEKLEYDKNNGDK